MAASSAPPGGSAASRVAPTPPPLPPVNPYMPALQIVTQHEALTPEDVARGCHVLRFKQFECDLSSIESNRIVCYGLWREYKRCPGEPNREITKPMERSIGGSRARAEALRQQEGT